MKFEEMTIEQLCVLKVYLREQLEEVERVIEEKTKDENLDFDNGELEGEDYDLYDDGKYLISCFLFDEEDY